jgi:hypothetical protein
MLGERKGTEPPRVDPVGLYTGRVLLDDDEQNPYRVTIDNPDSSSWCASLRGGAVPVPSQSQEFTVRLCEGDRNGQIATGGSALDIDSRRRGGSATVGVSKPRSRR